MRSFLLGTTVRSVGACMRGILSVAAVVMTLGANTALAAGDGGSYTSQRPATNQRVGQNTTTARAGSDFAVQRQMVPDVSGGAIRSGRGGFAPQPNDFNFMEGGGG
jgi:hypothetical protein